MRDSEQSPLPLVTSHRLMLHVRLPWLAITRQKGGGALAWPPGATGRGTGRVVLSGLEVPGGYTTPSFLTSRLLAVTPFNRYCKFAEALVGVSFPSCYPRTLMKNHITDCAVGLRGSQQPDSGHVHLVFQEADVQVREAFVSIPLQVYEVWEIGDHKIAQLELFIWWCTPSQFVLASFAGDTECGSSITLPTSCAWSGAGPIPDDYINPAPAICVARFKVLRVHPLEIQLG